jgi:hypothetical protein
MNAVIKLIEAADTHAEQLTSAAQHGSSDYGAKATEIEAQRWRQLASEARSELVQDSPIIGQ